MLFKNYRLLQAKFKIVYKNTFVLYWQIYLHQDITFYLKVGVLMILNDKKDQ